MIRTGRGGVRRGYVLPRGCQPIDLSDHPILTAGSPGGCQRSRIFGGTRDDYSIDPRFAGRRIGVRVSQTYVTVVMLNTGELACRHRRSFAGGLMFTDFARQTELDLDDSGLPDP